MSIRLRHLSGMRVFVQYVIIIVQKWAMYTHVALVLKESLTHILLKPLIFVRGYSMYLSTTNYIWHVPALGEKFCGKPGTKYPPHKCTFKLFWLLIYFVFFITLLYIIYSNLDCINFIIIDFLFERKILFSAIALVITFFFGMVNCSFKY